MYYNGEFFFRAWSVRAYNILRKARMQVNDAEDALAFADYLVNMGFPWGGGKKTAIEFYRAGGMGIYAIHDRVGGDLQRIRNLCEIYDYTLHQEI